MAEAPRSSSSAGAVPHGHSLILQDRRHLKLTGVVRVASFDEHRIVLATESGTLTLSGQDMDIKQFDVEQGSFCVEGLLTSLAYSGGRGVRQSGKGLMGNLFR